MDSRFSADFQIYSYRILLQTKIKRFQVRVVELSNQWTTSSTHEPLELRNTLKERGSQPTTSKATKLFHLTTAITIIRFLQVAELVTSREDLPRMQVLHKMEAFSWKILSVPGWKLDSHQAPQAWATLRCNSSSNSNNRANRTPLKTSPTWEALSKQLTTTATVWEVAMALSRSRDLPHKTSTLREQDSLHIQIKKWGLLPWAQRIRLIGILDRQQVDLGHRAIIANQLINQQTVNRGRDLDKLGRQLELRSIPILIQDQ